MTFASIIWFTLAFLFPDPQTPNYYPGMTSAREASKRSQKEMIIFFSDKTCDRCDMAWAAFTKDSKATDQYVSTRMDVDDFDGGVFFDLLDLKQVPSWVILYPDGTEKERWEGGWKDASGNPKMYDQTTIAKVEKQQINTSSINTSPSIQNNQQNKSATAVVKVTKTETKSTPTSTEDKSKTGYILQAGYFGSEVNAQKLLTDLKAKGFSSFEMKMEEKEGKMFYRVVSKMFESESSAKAEQQKLSAAGINVSIKT